LTGGVGMHVYMYPVDQPTHLTLLHLVCSLTWSV
jgi:hypothetical protein